MHTLGIHRLGLLLASLVAASSWGCGARSELRACLDPPCPDGGPCPSAKIADVDMTWQLAASGGRLYVAGSGAFFEIDPCSGKRRNLWQERPTAVAAFGGDVCWATSYSLHCERGGSRMDVATRLYWPSMISLDARAVFWPDNEYSGAIWRSTFGGPGPERIVDLGAAFVSDGDTLFWHTVTGGSPLDRCTIRAMPAHTVGASRELGSFECRNGVTSFLSDEQRLYWNDGLEVWSLANSGGIPVKLATVASPLVGNQLAIDATYVYYVGPSAGTRAVFRVGKTGGASTEVAHDAGQYALAVDDRYVYWADLTALYRVRK